MPAVAGDELVGLVRFVSAILTLALLPDAAFLAACVGRTDLDHSWGSNSKEAALTKNLVHPY